MALPTSMQWSLSNDIYNNNNNIEMSTMDAAWLVQFKNININNNIDLVTLF